MSGYFEDRLLRFLPEEFAIRDAEHGDLAAFLEVVAISLDDFQEFIDDFPKIFDVEKCPTKYLPYLAKMLNFPLNQRDDEHSQRLQLLYAVEWYKRKGLHECFRILFYSLGYVVSLVELWTKDYQQFFRYPGSWRPPVFQAMLEGTNLVMMDITPSNRNLVIAIDGGQETHVRLTEGINRTLVAISAEIHVALLPLGGNCAVRAGRLVVHSSITGAHSSVKIVETEASSYQVLRLPTKITFGIDYHVPDDWPELFENGGTWYKSPHFGVEAQAVRGYVIDPNEFQYIRSRIELARPAHTVLNFITYAKAVVDAFDVKEDDVIGTVEPGLFESWPFPLVIDRGTTGTYEYKRDGLVPNRSEETRVAYRHIRNADNNVFRRDAFHYNYNLMTRGHPEGPPQMPDRGIPRFYREGYPEGLPKRDFREDMERLEVDLVRGEQETWCAPVLRGGGLLSRGDQTEHLRDGSFTRITSRSQGEFHRGAEHLEFTRAVCKPPLETELEILYTRPDLPNVYFRSLSALADPDTLGIDVTLPGPGEDGPPIE